MKLLLILDWYFPRFLVYEYNFQNVLQFMKIHERILNYIIGLIATNNVWLNVRWLGEEIIIFIHIGCR